MRSITFPAAIALLLLPSALSAAEPRGAEAGKALHAFFEAEWDYEMEQSPVRASFLGDRRWNDRWETKAWSDPQSEQHAIEAWPG